MLPASARLTRSQDFRLVIRQGRRAGRARLVVHVVDTTASGTLSTDAARVGFIVSKAVGSAVVRHRVARRLRHLMRDRVGGLPAGTLVVVRVLPPAATASSRDLGEDLDAAFRKLRMPVRLDEHSPMDST